MKLEGEYVFEAGVQEVWDALFDPAVLAAVMPGCEKLDLVDGSYVGDIVVKVGPIQGKFSGKVDLSDKVEPKSYKMIVDGRGAQGFVKATATIVLEPSGTGTKIRYDSDAQVGGKIASVGQRLVETSARAIVKQSLDGLNENIKIRAEAYRLHNATTAPLPRREVPKVEAAPAAEPVKPAPEAKAAAVVAARTEPEAVVPAAKPASEPAPEPAPEPAKAAPVIDYKKADAGKLAATVAKEVTKTVAPIIAIVLVVVAILIYVLVR